MKAIFVFRADLQGKPVYLWWRLDKNISWFNVNVFWMGLLYGLLSFEFLRNFKDFKLRLKPGRLWLPMTYAKDYGEYHIQ